MLKLVNWLLIILNHYETGLFGSNDDDYTNILMNPTIIDTNGSQYIVTFDGINGMIIVS